MDRRKGREKSNFVVFNRSGLILFVGVVESSAAEEEDEEGGGDSGEEVNEVLEAEDINELNQPGETSG